MAYGKKIVLHSKTGYRPEMDALIDQFIRDGVKFVGVVGEDCAKIEDISLECLNCPAMNPFAAGLRLYSSPVSVR